MYVTTAKRLTHDGAKKMADTAVALAREAKIAISVAIADAGGHLIVLERMDGGRFHSLHSATTKAVCAASNMRPTSARGAQNQELDVAHAIGLALAAGPERWTAMEGGSPDLGRRRMHRRHRRLRRRLGDRRAHLARGGRGDRRQLEMTAVAAEKARIALASDPLRVACIGMGWWSDVLADAVAALRQD